MKKQFAFAFGFVLVFALVLSLPICPCNATSSVTINEKIATVSKLLQEKQDEVSNLKSEEKNVNGYAVLGNNTPPSLLTGDYLLDQVFDYSSRMKVLKDQIIFLERYLDALRSRAIDDLDGDGVPDDIDECLDTPPGTKVDEYGCPMVDLPPSPSPTPATPGPTMGTNDEYECPLDAEESYQWYITAYINLTSLMNKDVLDTSQVQTAYEEYATAKACYEYRLFGTEMPPTPSVPAIPGQMVIGGEYECPQDDRQTYQWYISAYNRMASVLAGLKWDTPEGKAAYEEYVAAKACYENRTSGTETPSTSLPGNADLDDDGEPNSVILDMCSLPSTQGWTYKALGNSYSESQIFSVQNSAEGCILSQNSLGVGRAGQGRNCYEIYNVINPSKPFILKVRARVLEEEGDTDNNHCGFYLSAQTGTEIFCVGIGPDAIMFRLENGKSWKTIATGEKLLSTNVDNKEFHDYRLEGYPGIGYAFYVDNYLVEMGAVELYNGENRLLLGDGTGGTNAKVDIASFEFIQSAEISNCLLQPQCT